MSKYFFFEFIEGFFPRGLQSFIFLDFFLSFSQVFPSSDVPSVFSEISENPIIAARVPPRISAESPPEIYSRDFTDMLIPYPKFHCSWIPLSGFPGWPINSFSRFDCKISAGVLPGIIFRGFQAFSWNFLNILFPDNFLIFFSG